MPPSRQLLSVALLVTAISAPAVWAVEPQPAESGVRGKVSAERPGKESASSPLGRVSVFAYELARASVTKATTAADGAFRFDGLPAGVYKLIAFKPGYEPGVVLLSRAAAEALQFVELKLAAERRDDAKGGDDFWAVRDEIPPDVLRELEGQRLAELSIPGTSFTPPPEVHAFQTAVKAMTGVENAPGGAAAQVAGGGIDMKGRIGSMRVGVSGEFWRLASPDDAVAGATPEGQSTALAVRMTGNGEGQLDVTTVSHRMAAENASFYAADFERYRVSWSQPLGERSRSRFLAQYTSQNNFMRAAGADAFADNSSRALNLEGAYQVEISDRSSLETGLRYRERDGGLRAVEGIPAQQRALELFGKGGWRFQPSVLVEYGLYTQLRDGSMALAPQGGVVVQLGDHWQAVTTASHRVEQGDAKPLDAFTPVRFAAVGQDPAGRGCQDLEEHCYRVLLARQGDSDDTTFAVGAVHRELAETVHLYFDD
ncbi:MAG TPA: carboxypeptidase-like regulatory domain-containing protein, partial [Thermoanaerobaculia bacterium]|nr:carboxypeptidase-like regulatory domain-containing protein [Thermoanaerobaculia bacterium]